MPKANGGSTERFIGVPRGLRWVLVLSVLLTLALVAILAFGQRSEARSTAASVLREEARYAATRFETYLKPVLGTSEILRDWARIGVLETDDAVRLDAKLIPMLESMAQIHSVLIGRESFAGYTLIRDGEGWLSWSEAPPGSERGGWRRYGPGGAPSSDAPPELPPPPVREAWYQELFAIEERGLHWTRPHPLYPGAEPGFSAFAGWTGGGDPMKAMVNLSLRELSRVVEEVRIAPAARYFYFAGGRPLLSFIPHPDGTRVVEGDPGDPVLASALAAWGASADPGEPFRWSLGGRPWWGMLIQGENTQNPVRLGVLVPEADLARPWDGSLWLYLWLALGLYWIGLLGYVRHRFRREAARAAREGLGLRSEEEIRGALAGGETDRLEFKSTLRWNLKSGKPGKEIELAALKTLAAYMNGEGGTLVVGVDDGGRILGLDRDGFENEDRFLRHFSSIFHEHLGLEFSDCVDFRVRRMGDRSVFIVDCRPSPRPVFLKHKGEEEFYIRVGPSSRRLTPSQVLEHVKEREKK